MEENKTFIAVSDGKIRIRRSTVIAGIMCFLLILPDDAFGWLLLYKSGTPSNIIYKWLNYNFGILPLFILIVGTYYAICLRKRGILLISFIMLFRECMYVLMGENNIFSASAYEMYLVIYVGYAFILWAEGSLITTEKCEQFFKWFLITNMLTLFINFAMGGDGVALEGRYHSSNLDVGATGTVCALCVLFLAYTSEKSWYDYCFMVLGVIGLLLSGSRSNFVFLILLFVWQYVKTHFTRRSKQIKKSRLILGLLLICVAITAFIIIISIYSDALLNWLSSSRYFAIFNSQDFISDGSVLGRIESIEVGLDILKHHPFGISGYFINLQHEMQLGGLPTFPHSTLLSMYLIFGPIVLVIYGMWFSMLKKLRLIDTKYYLIILYFLISTIIYGSPIVNFKILFMYGMPMFLSRRLITEVQYESCAKKEMKL